MLANYIVLRKEVIQPQVPLRLPCYDFTPVINPTFNKCLLAVSMIVFWLSQLPWCDGRCVQGPGTYSPRRSDPRLLAIPTSWSRVADSNPNWEWLFEIRSPSRVRFPLYHPLYHVCRPRYKGHEDLTSSPPSSVWTTAVPLECPTECWQLKARVALVAGLNPTCHHTSWRQPCSTCHFVVLLQKSHLCDCQRMSNLGKVLRVASN